MIHRRGIVLMAALVVALMLPLGAGAATRTFGGFPWKSTVNYPAGSFLAEVQANPATTYRVIVQVQSKQREHAVSGWAGTYGRTHDFNLINGVRLKLPGWAILFVAQHNRPCSAASRSRPDLPLKVLSAPDNGTEMQWPAAVGANPLWSHPAVPCAVDATGVKIDPACQDVPAYNAPQAPAIAIVDTGIDPTKAADFGSRIVASVDFSSLSPAGATGDQMGHGTMVAGIAAGASSYAPGVAQNAPLVDVRTGDAQGESLTSDVISALDWIDANKATYNIRVANMSMAGNQATSFRNDPLDKAVEQLWLNGVVVVAAAGNNGNADGTPSPIGAPANDPFVITVGGTDQAGTVTPADDTRAPWSAYGRTVDGFQKPEISAPARYMVAPVPMDSTLATTEPSRVVAPGYMWMSGTSFAAPQVSGAAAEILAEHPTWTPDQVKGALMVTATQTADTTGGTGVGELNAVAAVKGVATPPNPNLHLNDFVDVSATTGENVLDAEAWATYAKANPSWAPADYASSDWAVSDWAVSDWAVSDWAVSDWAVSDWAVSDWAVSDWAVSDWAVSDWAVSDWAVSDWAVSDWAVSDWAVSDWAVSETAP